MVCYSMILYYIMYNRIRERERTAPLAFNYHCHRHQYLGKSAAETSTASRLVSSEPARSGIRSPRVNCPPSFRPSHPCTIDHGGTPRRSSPVVSLSSQSGELRASKRSAVSTASGNFDRITPPLPLLATQHGKHVLEHEFARGECKGASHSSWSNRCPHGNTPSFMPRRTTQ